MKKISLLILTLVLSLISLNKLEAISGYTTGTNVIVRTGPGVDYERVTMFSNAYVNLDVVSKDLYNAGDSDCSIGWYKINYNGSERYICGTYVTLGSQGDNNPSYNTSAYDARIHGVNIQVRSSATSSSTLKTTLLPGTNIVVLSDKISGYGCTDGWYKIEYHKRETGYVCSKYVNKLSDIIDTDSDYEAYLKRKGFPDSYIPYLVHLHKKFPNWTFNAIDTDLNWDYVISAEEGTKNLINVTNDIYRVNDTQIEKGWYQTTSGVNAFYLDPRNFLTEKFIFMFESLNYNYGNDNKVSLDTSSDSVKMYYKTIKELFGSSYLSSDDYIYMFIGAGFQYNISPVHLASRVYQEGGANENYAAVSGTYTELYDGIYSVYGYYNYYNIGAYGSNPVLRGLAYACGEACDFYNTYNRPWNTREKAIYGGAYYLADGYINAGQNTMYFQKFNTSPTSPSKTGTHQYQANVLAPSSEAANSYTAYKDMGLLNLNFEFDIPIYYNMPDVVSLPTMASTVNTLKEIKVNGKLISGYDEDIVDYVVYIDKANTSITIDVTKNDSESTVEGAGTLQVPNDITEHKIVVTAENGSVKTYNLEIRKVEDSTSVDDILENLSVKVTGNIMNHISPKTQISTIEQSVLKYSPNATISIFSETGNRVNGSSSLSTGQTIRITSPSGETRTFNVVVTGDTNGDGESSILDLLKIQKHLLNSTKLSGSYLKAADTNGDGSVTILDLLRVQKYILREINL